MVNERNVAQYREEGYTLVDQVVPPGEMDAIQAPIDAFVEEWSKVMRPEHLDKPHVWNRQFLDIASHPRLLDAVAQFIGPNIVVFSTHVICKAKGDGLAVPWHQDGNYWPLEPMNVITLWLAIDDSNVENGCMRVIPRTQDVGPIEHEQAENPETKVLHEQLPARCVDESKAVNCVLKRGGCSFHAPYLIHGSTRNTSPRRRCGLTIRYMPPETKMLRTGKLSKWFAQHPLYLVRGVDCNKTNVYANV